MHGKLVVLDISESGKQIGEKLFALLDEKQKTDLATFVLERKEEKIIFQKFHARYKMPLSKKQIPGCILQKFMRVVYISVRSREK